MNEKIFTDPVCLMQTDESSPHYDYHHKTFYFCSTQCLQRFKEKPQLYISESGKPPPKKSQGSLVQQRVLYLDNQPDEQQSENLLRELQSMMGIVYAAINKKQLTIRYDLLQADIKQIEANIEKAGNKLSHKWGQTLRRAFIHYQEEAELDNLSQQPYDSHCSH